MQNIQIEYRYNESPLSLHFSSFIQKDMDIREQSIYNNSQSKRSIVDEINYRPLVSEADEDQSLVTDILRGKQATAGWLP